ncbi:unnamed protein product [Parnassius apollo]|uniref:(apollo) hypothetical protein n=1 Tax=Parnassius apollo TaxID=110799 RepID=A0A8S3W4W3_PARAO|nr:unnamed protein product [Parnassius apollo]
MSGEISIACSCTSVAPLPRQASGRDRAGIAAKMASTPSRRQVRDPLLRTDDLTLSKAKQICQAAEISKEESMCINGKEAESSQVDKVQGDSRGARSWRSDRGRMQTEAGRGPRGASQPSAAARAAAFYILLIT